MKQKLNEFKPHVYRRPYRKDSKIAEQKKEYQETREGKKESHRDRASTKSIYIRANYCQKMCMDMQEWEICDHCSELELENTELKRQILDL
ncbi:MAG: hypothetical protein MJE68_31415, partial [Proteobacteria bacterium]|nr:hypothetical protein [Pseudomonadota bacterium]